MTNDPETPIAAKKCENCDCPLPDHVDCRTDNEGLWFCLDCWNALAEDFTLIPPV